MADFLPKLLGIILKSAVSIVVLFLFARLMGKKQVSQLSLFDYIVGITAGSIAAMLSADPSIPLWDGLASLTVWAVFAVLISLLSMKSMTCRRLLDGTPTILIQNGKILEKNLRKVRFTINDLIEELRIKDIFNIAEVDYAILETNGKLSVLKNPGERGATATDLNIQPVYKGLSANVIIDGRVMKNHLTLLHMTEEQLLQELQKRNIMSFEEVLLACLNSHGDLFVDLKGNKPEGFDVLQ